MRALFSAVTRSCAVRALRATANVDTPMTRSSDAKAAARTADRRDSIRFQCRSICGALHPAPSFVRGCRRTLEPRANAKIKLVYGSERGRARLDLREEVLPGAF